MALPKLAPIAFAVVCAAAAPTQDTQFIASASPTHFTAINPNAFSVLMVLGDNAHGAHAQMLVAPGATFTTSFPSGTLDQLYIEVVFFSPAGRVSSGAVSFDSMFSWEAESVEIDLNGTESAAWICNETGRILRADSGVDLVPSSLMNSAGSSTLPLLLDPVGVPVITPHEIDTNDIAPKVRLPSPLV